MFPNRALIALGSNVGNWKINFNVCLKELRKISYITAIANIYMTKPYGYELQNTFFNTAVELKTFSNPLQLMKKLQLIEKKMHKNKTIENGPRRIDIDIIFFNNLKFDREGLTIPHPRATNRDFVICPLFDIAPFYKHPVEKKTIKQLKIEIEDIYILGKITQPKDSFVIY